MRTKILGLVVVGLAAGVSVVFHNCSPVSLKHQSFPPIGETVHLDAVVKAESLKGDGEYQHKLVYFIRGGRNVYYDESAEFLFMSADSDQPLYRFTTAELKEMYVKTDCPDYVSRHLENAFEGEGLFCNNSLDLSKVTSVIMRDKDGKQKTATSYVREYALDNINLIAVSYTVN